MPAHDGHNGQEVHVPVRRQKGQTADEAEQGAIRRERLCQWSAIVSGKWIEGVGGEGTSIYQSMWVFVKGEMIWNGRPNLWMKLWPTEDTRDGHVRWCG